MSKTQNYSNHTRWFPLFHFVIFPILLLLLVYWAVRLYREPSWDMAMVLALVFAAVLIALASRLQALKAQDRVIRLEERLRYTAMLTPELAARASELPVSQMIALRFASDGELAELVGKVVARELGSPKEIKMAIREWKADHHRV